MTEIYKRVPIVEAVIDVRVISGEPLPERDRVERFCKTLEREFPSSVELNSVQVEIGSSNSNPPEVRSTRLAEAVAFRLSNPRNDRVLQIRRDGLAFSHLPPYTGWDQFLKEFQDIWSLYSLEFPVSRIGRLAVRYINRIDISDGEDLDELFLVGPRMPRNLPQKVIGYFSQLVMPADDLGSSFRVVLNSGVEPAGANNVGAFVLDIDIFTEQGCEVLGDEPWKTLERLREYKNRVFEGCIADKCREKFK